VVPDQVAPPAGPVLTGLVEHTDGEPFGGVPLTVTDDNGEPVADVLYSDEEGRFELPLPAGSYIVIASPEGCQPDARRVALAEGVSGPDDGSVVEFVLDGDGLLYGRVVGAAEGVLSLLDHTGAVVAVVEIDEHGEYEIAGLRSGSYTLTAVVPGSPPVARQVEVAPGEAREVDLGLGPAEVPWDGHTAWDGDAEGFDGDVDGGSDVGSAPGPQDGPALHRVAFVPGGTAINGLPNGSVGDAGRVAPE
jgi:hypothetical protein